MKTKERVPNTGTHLHLNDTAKIDNVKDITKVYEFFLYTTGTTLDASIATGVLRNSITWYVVFLENENLLQAVCTKPDRHTGRRSKYYSADKSLWKQRPKNQQLNLFDDE